MKKILFIMHMPPPIHGASVVGKYIYKSRTINEAFDCQYINPSASSKIKDVGKLSIEKLVFFVRLLCNIRKTIRQFHPDLVYYTPTADGWGIYRDCLTIALIEHQGAKVILHMHNKGVKEFAKNHFLAKLCYKRIFKKTKVILLSGLLYPDIEKFAPKENVFILPNGIKSTISDIDYNTIVKNRSHNEKTGCSFLFLSNLISTKGIFILLEACEILKEMNINFECHFVGNAGDITIDQFKQYVVEKELSEQVFVEGPKYDEEKHKYFCDANVFVFPTFFPSECYPLVLLEAMEYGLPCISTFEGGIPQILEDGKTGFLVLQKDAKSLASKMRWIAEHNHESKRIGTSGREKFVEQYTFPSFERRFVAILNQCIEES